MADGTASADQPDAAAGIRRAAVRRFMGARGLKAAAWCRAAGLSANVLYNFLNGHSDSLSQDTLERLARAADAAVGDLLPGSPDGAARRQERPTVHWMRHQPEAGRPLLRRAEEVEALYADLCRIAARIGDLDAELLREARQHWSDAEIEAARRRAAEAGPPDAAVDARA